MHAAAAASSVVTTALHGDVLVVTIDNPPVNALGAAVRQGLLVACLLYTSPSPRDKRQSRMPSSA